MNPAPIIPSSVTKFSYQVQLLKLSPLAFILESLMLEGICMRFYKAIVQSIFKHVASENGPLILILQSYFQIFIVLKHID